MLPLSTAGVQRGRSRDAGTVGGTGVCVTSRTAAPSSSPFPVTVNGLAYRSTNRGATLRLTTPSLAPGRQCPAAPGGHHAASAAARTLSKIDTSRSTSSEVKSSSGPCGAMSVNGDS